MKKVLIALAVTMMAVTTFAAANVEPAQALQEECFINSNGDEVCVRFGPKILCIYINGVKQSCEQVWAPTQAPGEQDVPCDFLARGCYMFEASASTGIQLTAASTAEVLGHGGHPAGTIYVPCAFVQGGCEMWQRPGDLVLAHV